MPTDDTVAVETTSTPPGATVTPSGGIVTRTDGSETPVPSDWRASLPVELQLEKSLDVFKGRDWNEVGPNLAKGYVNAQRLVGKAADYPKGDAKPEDVAEYRRRAGVPESVDKYGITLPQAPSGQAWDKGQVDTFLGAMHAAHARPEVVQAALDHFVGYMATQSDRERANAAAESNQDRAAKIKQLEAIWGPQGGPLWRHQENRALGLLDHFAAISGAPPDVVQAWKESTRDPWMAHAWSEAAVQFMEDGYIAGAEDANAGGATAAQTKADEMREASLKDPQHPLKDPNHPDHQRVYAQYMALQAVAAGPRGREVVTEVRR